MKKSFQATVNHENMVYYPKNLEEFKYIASLFEDGSDVTITVETLVRKVSQSQMGLYFKYLEYFCAETGYDTEEADKEMKKRFGQRTDDGKLKSKSMYTPAEMNKLIDGTYNLMVTELNMVLATPEEWKKLNLK